MSKRSTLGLFVLFPCLALAQTTWNVNSGGSTSGGTLPYYAPQILVINVGDIVHWVNVSGTHSVNGSFTEFPANPEGFSSGQPANGGWTWDHTFTIPGLYHYHCTQQGHAATQNGTITVNDPSTGVAQLGEGDALIKVYPVPSSDVITVQAGATALRSAVVIGLNGERVLSVVLGNSDRSTIDIAALPAGNYFVMITDANGTVTTRPFSKR
ncbi:MAG: T9SS type A sorting domain-containing protein [Flavobacteriales bacterium]|nr:T9SS type A sorting domain-containing protein [Flavobacteriales bacterium]